MRTNRNKANRLWLKWNWNNFIYQIVLSGESWVFKRKKLKPIWNHLIFDIWWHFLLCCTQFSVCRDLLFIIICQSAMLDIFHSFIAFITLSIVDPTSLQTAFQFVVTMNFSDNGSFAVALFKISFTCVCVRVCFCICLSRQSLACCERNGWKKKYQKHAQTIPYDNYHCGQSLINERKIIEESTRTNERIEWEKLWFQVIDSIVH